MLAGRGLCQRSVAARRRRGIRRVAVMGFRHISLLRWKDGTDSATRDAVFAALRTLPGQIAEIRSYVLGTDAGISEGNFDLAIVADFDDQAAYSVYRDHPVHRQLIADMIVPIVANRAAVQHEL